MRQAWQGTRERDTEVQGEHIKLGRAPARGLRCAAAMAVLTLMVAVPVIAQQTRLYRDGGSWVEETSGSLPVSVSLVVRMGLGNVNVQGGTDAQVRYVLKKRVRAASQEEAQRLLEPLHFSVVRPTNATVLEGTVTGMPPALNAELTVQVPRAIRLVKITVLHGGNAAVSGVSGRAEVWTSAGNVRLEDIEGLAQGSSGGGNFEVARIGGDAMLNTGGGTIRVKSVKGAVSASTGGGDVRIESVGHSVTSRTGAGTIDVKQCGGSLNATTNGGIIRLNAIAGPVTASTTAGALQMFGLARGATAHTGGGGVTVEFLGNDFAPSVIESQNGDIVVYLGESVRATVLAEVETAAGHHVRSDFPEINQNGDTGPGSHNLRAEGKLKGGGPLLRVRASSGDIEFRRARH